jgi:hypothetical protein
LVGILGFLSSGSLLAGRCLWWWGSGLGLWVVLATFGRRFHMVLGFTVRSFGFIVHYGYRLDVGLILMLLYCRVGCWTLAGSLSSWCHHSGVVRRSVDTGEFSSGGKSCGAT